MPTVTPRPSLVPPHDTTKRHQALTSRLALTLAAGLGVHHPSASTCSKEHHALCHTSLWSTAKTAMYPHRGAAHSALPTPFVPRCPADSVHRAWHRYNTSLAGEPAIYVKTGDIDAMWIRDSSAQVSQLLVHADRNGGAKALNEEMRGVLAGVRLPHTPCTPRTVHLPSAHC